MVHGTLKANLLAAFCLAAFTVALTAAPTQAGRPVTLAEADNIQGAACGGPATTTSTWCSVVCTYSCFSTGCAACGCPTTADPGGTGNFISSVTPCGTQGCGSKPFYYGSCAGS